MDRPVDFEKLISSLKCFMLPGGLSSENAKDIHEYLTSLLTSENGVCYMKQHPMNLEVVLPLFIKIIFHSDRDIAQSSLKHSDVVVDLFRSSLPKIKKEGWWKQFEPKTLPDLIDSLRVRVEGNDETWVATWTFITNVVITEKLNISLFNKLLSVTEHAFKKGRDNLEIKDNAWLCWMGLIDAFGRSPQILVIHRAVNLLLKPLLSVSSASVKQIDTWVHLLLVKGLSGPAEVVKSIVDPMLKSLFNSGDKSASRILPDVCANALIKTLSYDHVVQHCLPEYIGVFEACVDSRPSAELIEQLAGVLVQSINNVKHDAASFKMWKILVEHYNHYVETPTLSQACLNILTDINFHRWIDSSTIEAKEIAELMDITEFRDKVLIKSIKLLAHDETNTKKKSKKGTWEEVWSNYCEAYVSWWSTQPPSDPKGSEDSAVLQSLQDSCDYQAVRFLLLHPLQLTIWNPTVSKTWSNLCEACHSRQFLHCFVKAIFDALGEPNFQVQKAIIISDCLYKLDQNFCKQSAKVLESISNEISNMEFQNLSDLLSLTETAALYPEMSSVLFQIFKNANDRSSEFEQFDAHRIKTKVNKIMRKLEQLTNSGEKEKTPKIQRAPFRAQSNFLQRLAKAVGKNKTKSPFLTSMLPSPEKGKNCLETEELATSDVDAMDTSDGNGLITDENKKPLDHLDESEVVPIIALPSVLKSSPARENTHTEGIVAEKENGILSIINGTNTTSALTICSPKIKITNAREVKTVDATSPAAAKKPKPVAGQKSTPKKVTPSKVSYFDDDANDCVMVPPRAKTTPLTEHQMEMMSKRRTDIPALYQDLSQDTQLQQVAVVQEVLSGAPQPIQESQDIVPGTPSPKDCPAPSTPEIQKSSRNNSLSAKKLDFNNLPPLPSKTSPMNDDSSNCDPLNSDCVGLQKIDTLSRQSEKCAQKDPATNGILSKEIQPLPQTEDVGEEPKPATEEKSKRKRKVEQAKFSPKLTRSKRSLKSATPDAKLKSSESNLKDQTRVKSHDVSAKMSKTKSPQHGLNNLDEEATNAPIPSVEPKSLNPLCRNIEEAPVAVKIEESQSAVVKTDDGSTPVSDSGVRCAESSQLAKCDVSNSLAAPEALDELCPDEPRTAAVRKRKIVDSSIHETPKKMKSLEDDCLVVPRNPANKKKKPFKLGAGGNLESWLVKTDRSPSRSGKEGPPVKSGVNCENEMNSSDEVVSTSERVCSNQTGVDLDNSEEIVPSTQECLVENNKPLLTVLETKIYGKSENEEVVAEIEEHPIAAVQDEVKTHLPDKPEGSVLEQLSNESPNDDDMAVVISPSKRQMRASSVFRNGGDSYVFKKEKASCVMSEQVQDDSKLSFRSKIKPTSPSSRNAMGGRSAKMLRLATSTTTQEEDDIVVTPVRRRGNIVPVKYGDNWPKGTVEDWVACTPASPCMSPFRSALKRTPAPEDNVTPQRCKNDSMASPLLSSAKRKRVVFLDPPVTLGLSYEIDSPGGSVFHADVPQGSPYPVWKGEDERRRGIWDEDKVEISPSKRDVERLKSLSNLNAEVVHTGGASSSKLGEETPELNKPLGVSDAVRQLIDPAEPATILPSHLPDMNQFQEKFMLSDAFMAMFSEIDTQVRSLLVECFYCSNMAETVDAWKFGDCRRVCQMPHSLLLSVRNLKGDVLTEVLSSGVFPAPSPSITVQCTESSAQTDPRVDISIHTQTEPTATLSVATNTEIATTTSSTQVEAQLKLPSIEDWPSISEAITLQGSLNFLSDSLRVLSSSLPKQ